MQILFYAKHNRNSNAAPSLKWLLAFKFCLDECVRLDINEAYDLQFCPFPFKKCLMQNRTQNNFWFLQLITKILFNWCHIFLLNAACDLKFLSDSTCTNLWSYSSITPCLSYIRYMYTDYAYCINLSWIKYMYICVFANKVAGNRELNYKHWQLFFIETQQI